MTTAGLFSRITTNLSCSPLCSWSSRAFPLRCKSVVDIAWSDRFQNHLRCLSSFDLSMIIIILKLSKRKRKMLAKMLRFTQIFDTLLLLIFERTGASHVSVPPLQRAVCTQECGCSRGPIRSTKKAPQSLCFTAFGSACLFECCTAVSRSGLVCAAPASPACGVRRGYTHSAQTGSGLHVSSIVRP